MPAFVVAYVPNVENVDNVEKVKQVDTVKTVEDVNTVHDVQKLPHPYFPLKKYNYQSGGAVHITETSNLYQAVYVPDTACELKGIHLCFTSYNIEDTYDVMVGSRYVIKGSHVKEMTEHRMLEVYEDLPAGTPITITFHNNSGLEKYLLYEFITLVDEKVLNTSSVLNWSFNWKDETVVVGAGDKCTLVIPQPNYVNMDSNIKSAVLEITDILTQQQIATIEHDGYVETDYQDPFYPDEGYLARVNVMAIVQVTLFERAIQIVFKNIDHVPHPIQLGVKGSIVNILEGV